MPALVQFCTRVNLLRPVFEALSCRGLCKRHPRFSPTKKIDYAKGMKVCTICDMAVFVDMPDNKCPCCNKNLRTRPQYHGEKGRVAREAVSKRTTSW